MLVSDDENITIEQFMDAWHPDLHEWLRQQASESRSERVQLVTFGDTVAPDSPLAKSTLADRPLPYQPGPSGPGMEVDGNALGVVRILQLRDEDGALRLTMRNKHNGDPENRLAMQLLSDADLAKALVRAHLQQDEP